MPKEQARIKIAKLKILNLYASENTNSTVKTLTIEWGRGYNVLRTYY